MGTQLPPKGHSNIALFGPCLLWQNGYRWIKMPLATEVCLGPGHTVVHGDPAPPQKGNAVPPIFGPCLLWPNSWMEQDDIWHGGGPSSSPHCARWGPSCPPQKRGQSPQFLVHFYSGQTAGCIKMQLAMEVGLSPGDFVFDGDTATPRKKGTSTPTQFWPTSIVAKRLDR